MFSVGQDRSREHPQATTATSTLGSNHEFGFEPQNHPMHIELETGTPSLPLNPARSDANDPPSGYSQEVLKARVERITGGTSASGSNNTSSMGSNYTSSSMGRRFDFGWSKNDSDSEEEGGNHGYMVHRFSQDDSSSRERQTSADVNPPRARSPLSSSGSRPPFKLSLSQPLITSGIGFSQSPRQSPSVSRPSSRPSSRPPSPRSAALRSSSATSLLPTIPQKRIPSLDQIPSPTSGTHTPSSPHPRRRSSARRISLIAGRLSVLPPSPPPSEPADLAMTASPNVDEDEDRSFDNHRPGAPKLLRLSSTSSFMSMRSGTATAPGTPGENVKWLGDRSISEYLIEGDVGRGAYGLVKKGREVMGDGTYGPEVIIKQVIKSRILADCWKKHPTYGTIPIEIYVLVAVSNATYILPERRPWDPSRRRLKRDSSEGTLSHGSTPTASSHNLSFTPFTTEQPSDYITAASNPSVGEVPLVSMTEDFVWEEGKMVRGHPNICPLLDFFEDRNFYYLILPSSLSESQQHRHGPKDLFDLVEIYPKGLPPFQVRSYLGQIADAMAFLHSRAIVHRDIKDENVVLGGFGGERCWLIDFGSAGIVRRNGWNSFSGTLDYASPEILRGEYYTGKEQDVWAFGVVAFVLLVGECPFETAQDAQHGLSPEKPALSNLQARCLPAMAASANALPPSDSGALADMGGGLDDVIEDGEEEDGGARLIDAMELVKACLDLDLKKRPTFEAIMRSRFLSGRGGWERWTVEENDVALK